MKNPEYTMTRDRLVARIDEIERRFAHMDFRGRTAPIGMWRRLTNYKAQLALMPVK